VPKPDVGINFNELDIAQLVLVLGVIVFLGYNYIRQRYGKKNGEKPAQPTAIMPNGFAALKEDVHELREWSKSHTEKFDGFIVSSKEKDATHTEQIREVTRRIDRIENASN